MDNLPVKRLTLAHWQEARESIALFWQGAPDEGTIRQFLGKSHNILLSAEIDSKPVGQAIGYILDRWDRDGSTLFLYSIDVAQGFRRRGIGKALIRAFQALGETAGCSEMFVFTNASNLPAMRLYESTGGVRTNLDDVMFEYK